MHLTKEKKSNIFTISFSNPRINGHPRISRISWISAESISPRITTKAENNINLIQERIQHSDQTYLRYIYETSRLPPQEECCKKEQLFQLHNL